MPTGKQYRLQSSNQDTTNKYLFKESSKSIRTNSNISLKPLRLDFEQFLFESFLQDFASWEITIAIQQLRKHREQKFVRNRQCKN